MGGLIFRLIRFAACMTLVAVGLFNVSPDYRAIASTGQLEINAASDGAFVGDSTFTVRLANNGDGDVKRVTVECEGPPGVTVGVQPQTIADLPGHSSVFVKVRAEGTPTNRPAKLVVTARGESATGQTVALGTIELQGSDPVARLTLAGGSKLTESSPAVLSAIVENLSDGPIEVEIRATAAHNAVRLAPVGNDVAAAEAGKNLMLSVPGRETAVASIQVSAEAPVRRGSIPLVVSAALKKAGLDGPTITASRELEVTVLTDALPGVIGIGSLILVPGFLAVWAFLMVLRWDRKRIGLETPSVAARMWQEKLWLLAAIAVSLVVITVYSRLGFANLLDTYSLPEIATVSVVSGILGACAGAILVAVHRWRVRRIHSESDPLDVLAAAAKFDDKGIGKRRAFQTADGEVGLLVHKDWGALILAPPTEYTCDLDKEIDSGSLDKIVQKLRREPGPLHGLRFAKEQGTVQKPTAVQNPAAIKAPVTPAPERDIVIYRDKNSGNPPSPLAAAGSLRFKTEGTAGTRIPPGLIPTTPTVPER